MPIKGKITKKELHESVLRLIEESAGSNNSGGATKLVHKKSSTIINTITNTVAINIPEFNKNSDILMVHKNSVYIEENEDYIISEDGMSIVNPKGNWNEINGEMIFNFVVLKSVPKVQSGDVISSIIKIASTEWVYSDEEGLYYKDIAHNLGTEYINITAMSTDTKDSVELAVNYVNNNTIKVYSDSNENVTVYLQSANTTTDLVMNQIDDSQIKPNTTWSSTKLDTRFDTIENNLSKSENIRYETTNCIKDFELSQDGYIDNIHIEGNTLRNIHLFKEKQVRGDNNIAFSIMSENISDSRQVTVFNHNDKDIVIYFVAPDKNSIGVGVEANSTKYIDISEEGYYYYGIDFPISSGWATEDEIGTGNVLILEGDHTDKFIQHFEGIKSVGQGNKLNILTCKSNNNLLTNITFKNGCYIDSITGTECEANLWTCSNEYIQVEPNTTYLLYGVNLQLPLYDSTKTLIPTIWYKDNSPFELIRFSDGQSIFTLTTPYNCNYIKVNIPKIRNYCHGMYLCKYDNKQIHTTLRSLPNGVKDEIVKRGNKYYKIKRCEEYTITGNEEIIQFVSNNNTMVFAVNCKKEKIKLNEYNISNKFKCIRLFGTDYEHFYLEQNVQINIEILKNRLITQDVQGFKDWLIKNSVTIVYELEEPVIEQLPNFNIMCFGPKTTFVIDDIIPVNVNFEVTNSLGSELEVIKEVVSDLSDKKVKTFDIIGLNGWSIVRNVCTCKDGHVIINGFLKQGVLAPQTVIGQIPKEFAPSDLVEFSTYNLHTDNSAVLAIFKDGRIVVDTRDIIADSNWTGFNISYHII